MRGRKKGEATQKAQKKRVQAKIGKRSQSAQPPLREDPPPRRSRSGRPFPIVGIGGSAGALSALQEFFGHLPADAPLGFVVVNHGDPKHPSLLPEILSRCTRMPVRPAADGAAVESGSVHVAPAGRHIEIEDRVLRVKEVLERGHAPLPIDAFFRSLARDQRQQAIGIVLSGTGTDGTLGLRAIREASGLTLVQEPGTAEFGGMPASALASGVVDQVLPVAAMPAELLSFARGAARDRPTRESGARGSSGDLEQIVSLVASYAGQDFFPYKRGTLQRRVERRMTLHQIAHLRDYVRYLQDDRAEIEALWRDWLIGVTSFFRDREAFVALAETFACLLAQSEEAGRFRIWIPGCATGEEAYSLAITFFEALESARKHLNLQIFATDLDPAAVEVARSGRYRASIAADVSPERLLRFFDPEDGEYRIKKHVRDCIVFAPHNLLRDPPFLKVDLISCRNLLIYLKAETQKHVLPLFHYSLKPGGLLFLGGSESVTGFEDLFEPSGEDGKLFRRRETSTQARLPMGFSVGPQSLSRAERGEPGPVPRNSPVDYLELLSQQLAERYAPPAVIVDERGQILQIHGRTGAFLEPAPGRPALDLLEMARRGLRAPLASALRQVSQTETPIVEKSVRVKSNGGMTPLKLVVWRVSNPRLSRPVMLVSFEPAAVLVDEPQQDSPSLPPRGRPDRPSVLEDELFATHEDLRSTIEQLQSANEELAAANEEVQSVNEELQSTNEELMTSKEETQSLNEELETVNAELSTKVASLERSQDDLVNFMNATQLALVFLDDQLRLKRFTHEAQRLLRLIASDVGRPLSDLSASFHYPALMPTAEQVLRTLTPSEVEVQTADGIWWTVQMRPYRTSRNAIEGLTLVFVDVTRVKEASARDEEARALESIVDTVREPLLVLDCDLRVVRANASFYRIFRTESQRTEQLLIYELGDGHWDIPELRRLLERILPEQGSFDAYAVEHEFPGIGRRRMLLNARRITRQGSSDRILLAIEDVTDRGRSAEGSDVPEAAQT
jgi:two-component system CheB/CheR fusion protein